MWRKFLSSIRIKLLVPGLLALLILQGLLQWFWLPVQTRAALERIAHEQEATLHVLNLALTTPLLSGNLSELHSILDQARKHNIIWSRITLIDATNQRIYPLHLTDSGREGKEQTVEKTIEFNGKPLARLILEYDPAPALTPQIRAIRNMGWIIFGMVIGLLLLNFILHDWLIRRPASAMIQAAQRLAGGDFQSPIKGQREDEIGYLAEALEVIRRKVKTTMEDMEREKTTIQAIILGTTEQSDRVSHLNAVMTATALEATTVIVASATSAHDEQVHILSLWSNGRLQDNPDSALSMLFKAIPPGEDQICITRDAASQIPNGHLLPDTQACLATKIRDSHGAVIGYMLAAFNRPLADPTRSSNIFLIFATYLRSALATAAMEHRRVEQAVHTQAILDNMAEGIVVIDKRGDITSINPSAVTMFGYAASEVVGRNVSMLMPEPYRSHHDGYIARYLATGHERVMGKRREMTGQRKNGNIFPMDLQVTQVLQSGDPVFIGSVRDTTDAKAAETALREAHEMAQRYLDTASVMLLSLDTKGRVTMINRKGCLITGYDAKDLHHRNWFTTCIPETDRDELAAYYQAVITGQEKMLDYHQIKLVTINGEIRTLYWYANLLHNASGDIIGALFSGEDITDSQRIIQERRQLQQQLAQAQKMDAIGQLTGGIAHDFNNMLAVILGFTELAQEHGKVKGDEELVGYLTQVMQSSERARDLVAKMLAFSRQRETGAAEPILLSSAIPEMLKLLRPVLLSSVIIETRLESAPPVLIDTVELQQLLMNLCINARDAMNNVGTLSIAVRKITRQNAVCCSCQKTFSGDYTELSVSDTGSGMTPETLKKIFEPFFTTKEVGKGTGMGLAMLHGIMHDREGHIEVDTAPGKGSRFKLLFPCKTATQ